MNPQNKILAVIWDFDGTIADSRQKNYNVTKRIIKTILDDPPTNFPVLSSLEKYNAEHMQVTNWREFYKKSFSMTDKQVDEAGRLWTGFQLDDPTPVPLIRGVENAISKLSIYPQAIVSQNSRDNIIRYLKEKNVFEYFQTVIGYEEVEISRQKPLPDGLLICLDKLTDSQPGHVIYLGDHKTDVQCVINTNEALKDKGVSQKVISLGAFYGFDVNSSGWDVQPDYEIMDAGMITNFIDDFQQYNK